MGSLSRKAAIVGVDESDEIGIIENKSRLQHGAEASFNALEDAGLTLKDVDSIFVAGPSPYIMAEYLGFTPRYCDGTNVGGSSFVIFVEHALAAISAGLIDVALIVHGETGRSSRAWAEYDPNMPNLQFEHPYGFVIEPHAYGLAASRYMHEFGQERTQNALGEIAVSTRKWAQLNPKALMKDPMTLKDYHESRWISWPFHIFDCCLVTDGGGACVVTSADAARNTRKKPVWVLGSAEGHDHGEGIVQQEDLTSTIARETGPRALAMAGVTHDDIDLTMVYDSFTYTTLITLESLGFCKKGEGPDFVANQRTAPGGEFPLNTNGGGLSYTHTGMYGMFLLLEATRQLRGECGERQVKDAKLAIVNGTGGTMSSCGTLVLGAD
ncbi:MAG: acetyl-CoA acetyltransferase [Dehalococcoidia bacterium]